MLAQVHIPETLTARELDQYLEGGWFRMGQTIFTTNFLNFKERFYSALWLRIVLDRFLIDKTHQNLIKRNAAFKIEIKEASITPEKEELYVRYKQGISFDASPSLQHLLFGKTDQATSIYNTREINIYDGDKLIATGFFDLGTSSAAGISSFYDPAYKKYSLGKYLIYQKINYCKELGLQYFYPGYFVPGYSFFDYKLTIGKPALEYLRLTSQQWFSIHNFSIEFIPFQVMNDKLDELQQLLVQMKVESKLLSYAYFDANLVPELREAGLFDSPLFLYPVSAEMDSIHPVIVIFDVLDQQYHLVQCLSVWTSDSPNGIPEIYSSHLLKVEYELFSTKASGEMAAILSTGLTSAMNE